MKLNKYTGSLPSQIYDKCRAGQLKILREYTVMCGVNHKHTTKKYIQVQLSTVKIFSLKL